MTLFEELTRRGLVAQITHAQEVEELLDSGPQTFYIGFDATADSLHVGHFMQLVIIRRMLERGHKPILLLGTGTTIVGDPSGRTDMRPVLTTEEINYNADCFLEQMAKVVDIDSCIVVRNGDWLAQLGYLDLLKEVGAFFSVNKMLSYDSFKSRWERGLSFLEFNYMIMQSYDFLHLYRNYNCKLQFGGNDQWANIISGVDLVRRVEQAEVFGMTFTLLQTKEGKKMGKTQSGAVWLDAEKTSPYEFFQYWRNVDDAEVINCLKLLTFVDVVEIEAMESWQGAQLNNAKEILAFELTKDVHGKLEADKCLETSKSIFAGSGDSDNMPSTTLAEGDFTHGAISVLSILAVTGLSASNGESRRLIGQNGVNIELDGEGFNPITDPNLMISKDQIQSGNVIIRKGKKVFHKVVV